MKLLPEESKNVLEFRNRIRDGLSEIGKGTNWLEEYELWREDDSNRFDSILEVVNPFDLANVGNRDIFNLSDPDDKNEFDILCMSAFLSENLRKYLRQAVSEVKSEKKRDRKKRIIELYFGIVDEIVQSENLSACILVLNDFAEIQRVLFGRRSIDLYVSFFSLRENLRKQSIESLDLLFEYWRITKSKKLLKKLVSAIIDYIQSYYEEFNKDPDMHLFQPMEGLMITKKLDIIVHWLKHIAFHTNGIFEKYIELNWLRPVDELADEIIETNQISKYEMYIYKRIFSSDDDETVQKKAICNHGYVIWNKTTHVIRIVCDIFNVLYGLSDIELKKINTSKAAILQNYDIMKKVGDYYKRNVFFHQVYFDLETQYHDPQVIDEFEEDADRFAESVDDVIKYVEAIAGDDIDGLLQAKQKYIKRISIYISENQEEKLDELTSQVTEKIKATVQKLEIYNELYRSVSNEFLPYAGTLMQHPQIFSTLVSAEYLYQQYVEKVTANSQFDYSCISIMYYMSLEDFLNKLVYTVYENEVLSCISDSDLNDNNWRKKGSKDYVSSFFSFWDKKNHRFKKSCEIGVLGFLFQEIKNESKFCNFITSKYPKTDVNRIEALGIRLRSVAPRRNEAAHGGNYLTYNDVKIDKEHVYIISVPLYKGLILELLDILL